jgi:O-antigen ligase
MKWIFIAGVLLLSVVMTALLRAKPRYLVPTAFALGVTLFVVGPTLYAAPIPWPAWQGTVKGLEVSFIDGLSIAIILATKPVRIPWSIKLPFALLCFALVISTSVALQYMASFFYAWQLLRAVLLFIAVARICGTVPRAPIALLAGMAVGLAYEAGFAAYQYGTGVARPGGNLGHSNFLGLASDFVVFPAMALLLGTRRFWWPALAVISGLAIAITGGSRATLGLTAIGLLLTLIFSLQHGSTSRKFAFGGAAAVLLLASVPVIMSAAHRRSAEELTSSDSERGAMKLAARMIMSDHPLGVGANQYVIVANMGGYSQRAGVAWNEDTRAAPVHDTYYLVAAELGVTGAVAFVAMLGAFILLGFRALRKRTDDESNELVPGLLATMIVVAVHISYEWVFMHFVLHYLFAIAGGMLVGVRALVLANSQNLEASDARPSRLAPRLA